MTYTNLVLSVLIFFFASTNAHAYLDPGTGSILIQGLIAAIAGGLFTIRLYWQKVKSFFVKDEESSNDEIAETDLDADIIQPYPN